jgi:ABC-type multidrug transport system ATPase subunit
MVEVNLNNLCRRFGTHWVFKNINHTLKTNEHTVVLGSNGSGKSTLLKIVSGIMSPTSGELIWKINNLTINADNYYQHLSICTPYLSLPEEFTLKELLSFHLRLKGLKENYSHTEFAHLLQIEYDEDKPLNLYSSGMKQRVKLALTLLSKSKVILLDEPLSNLDAQGVKWYKTLVKQNMDNKIILVCSNNLEDEYFFCQHQLDIMDYKSQP